MTSAVLGIGIAATELNDIERELLRNSPPAAVVLFGRNIESVEQLRSLVAELRREAPAPLLVMVDQEGGRVDRLRPLFPGLPGADQLGAAGSESEALATEAGELTGAILRYFDIDVSLAPVVDVERETPAPGVERRSFGRDSAHVTAVAGAFLRGMHARGVGGCLKHFPGIGAATADTHYGAAALTISAEELRRVDLPPFTALANECRAVMVGHGSYTELPYPDRPASVNPTIIRTLLREDVGFEGLVISDDMEMHAVSDLGSFSDTAEQALVAGNDIVLFCAQVEAMPSLIRDLNRLTETDPALRARVDDAIARISEYREHVESLRRESERLSLAEIRSCLKTLTGTLAKLVPEQGRVLEAETPGTGTTGREEWT